MLAAKSTWPFPGVEVQSLTSVLLFGLSTSGLRSARFVIVLFALLSMCTGCATQADIQQGQNELGAIRSQLANTSASVNSLRREVERVQGDVEELRNHVNRVSQQGSGSGQQLRKIEERLASVEGRLRYARRSPEYELGEPAIPRPGAETGTPALPFGVPSVAAPAPPTATQVSAEDSPECQDGYRSALRLFQGQKYSAAIQEFRSFQRNCPDSKMADDAQYWIGESHYVQNDYNRAILEFNDVLSYRRGDRVAAALLRQAQAFLAIGDKTDARLILQKLVSDYPSASQVTEAQSMLQTIGR